MTKEDDLHAAIDLIYEAVLDDTLWPKALTRLADAMGTAQIGLLSLTVAPAHMIRSRRIPIRSWTRSSRNIGPSIIRFGPARSRCQPARYSCSIA